MTDNLQNMDQEPKPNNNFIQAQQLPMYPGQMDQQYVQGIPVVYQGYQQYPQMGHPQMGHTQMGHTQIGYPQMNQQQLYYSNQQPYLGHAHPGQQQGIIINMMEPINQKAIIEERIRSAAKWFNGCNSVWAIYIFINLISRCIDLFGSDSDSNSVGAGVIFVIENLIWIATILVGIYGMSTFNERLLLYYQYGLGVVMLLELVGSIIVFTTIEDGGTKALMVIFFILTMLCLSAFIHHAKQLRGAVLVWLSMNEIDAQQGAQ